MAEQQLNAPPCASSGTRAGVTHVRHRHTERFTVVGNHLAQHSELSPTAIGLAVHIQSLPDGTRVDIKSLSARFESTSTARIAAALRELEQHGYLERNRHRTPAGRHGIRTVFHEKPTGVAPSAPRRPAPRREPARRRPAAQRQTERRHAAPAPAPAPPRVDLAARMLAGRTGHGTPLPVPIAHPEAAAVLAGLRRDDHRLLLSQRDVDRLAPAVAQWLDRGASPGAIRHALTTGLPAEPIHHPAALIGHRLAACAPPPLPDRVPEALRSGPRPHPLQNCPGCERAFRAARPGKCRDCHEDDLTGRAVAA